MVNRGYWVASVEIRNMSAYQKYMERAMEVFGKFGGKYIVRGGKAQAVEGGGRTRIVVVEFKDYDTAIACYHSPEYAEAVRLREGSSINEIVVVEGYSGEQPRMN